MKRDLFLVTTASWGVRLWVYGVPRDNFDCNRHYMNKDEFPFEFNFVIVLDLLGWQG